MGIRELPILAAALPHPWIDRPDCLDLVAAGHFGGHSGRALQLHEQGFCLLRPRDPHWLSLLDEVLAQLEPLLDLSEWRSGADARLRLSDAWRDPATPAVRQLALHPEILGLLRCCYGREPFAFQTLNFPVGSNQAIHSDATHFHCEPAGFMAGVWVALEDVAAEAGPLVYCPGSHRLPYVGAAELELTPAEVRGETHPQRLFEAYWQERIESHGWSTTNFEARRGDVLVWHANLLHGGARVLDHQLTRWSQVSHYMFAGCRFTSPMQTFAGQPTCYRELRDVATGRHRPAANALLPGQLLKRLTGPKPYRLPTATATAATGLDLTGTALIDAPDCEAQAAAGAFGPHAALALQLHRQGHGLLTITDTQWLSLLERVRRELDPLMNREALSAGQLEPLRFQDAWLHQGLASVRNVACHPEILAALRVLYGREPFPFQTLNFPNGTAQHFHSDAVHFHSLPHGFMCGVWVALEDIHADAGPLEYYSGSHRLPYQRARDLGLSLEEVLMDPAPQRFFEAGWREQVKREGYERRLFLARRGEVLIWHANLLHGGAPVRNKTLSRWSQVSHYYFRGCAYTTPLLQTVDSQESEALWQRQPLELNRARD